MKIEVLSSLVIMSFYWLCICNHVLLVSALCLDHQKSLLFHFKNNLTFPIESSRKLKWWNTSNDCCRWMGVTCDKDGYVTGLDLSGESISGGFDNSSVLFDLQHLQKLNLADNVFSSSIPSRFYKLDKLTYLNLSYAGFVGQIPIEISQLTRLVTLDLSFLPYLTMLDLKLEIPNLGKLVQNMTNMRQLYLDYVNISASGHEWCNALLPLHDLQELIMSGCNLFGPLDPFLARLENLSVIILSFNDLSSPVPQTFGHFKNLTILSLSYCDLTGTFPLKIFNIGTLSVIDISHNDNLHGFFPDFPLSKSLRTLTVSSTSFDGALPQSIGNISHLSSLDLSECRFNGIIPNSLSNLTQLNYLDLSHNNFISPIPSFSMAKKLTYLDISNNDLGGTIPSSHFEGLDNLVSVVLSYNSFNGSIPSSIFTLPWLQVIDFSSNQLSQINEFINVSSSMLYTLDLGSNNLFGSIPSSIFTLSQLQNLYLSNNQFSQIDEFINVSSSVLETFDLSSNNLSRPFPTSFFQLPILSNLLLSSNNFNGSTQLNKLRELKDLEELDLSYNNLLSVNEIFSNVDSSFFPNLTSLTLASCGLRNFPSFLRNFSKLQILDLSNNQIQGIVPSWIWKIHKLQVLDISNNLLTHLEGPLQNLTANIVSLDLHANKLQGSLPIFFENADYLDLSSNKFSSSIPQDIGKYLSRIVFLSLSNNNLHGNIPDSLCNASGMQMLDLSINKISGIIPSCLMKMSNNLEVLNLKNNKLSGFIPNTISTICALWTLNLHGNVLEGPIPTSIVNCLELEVLDLGSNQFIDYFPCFLKEISTLGILVLRNNKFQGSIKCSKIIKTWEMLQIVDIAFNNFSGKLSGKFFTTWERYMMHNEHLDESSIIEEIYSGSFYYQDSVTIMNKGQEMELVKILKIYTSIDFSSNHFEGPIPEELMDFKELHILNLSNNAFSGKIPSSISNMRLLESLDLSQNSLSGEIPMQLASLSFLSYLNLSFNHFVGKIPIGTQIQSFTASSFEGNNGLYGPPLIENTNGKKPAMVPQNECGRLACTVDWNFISVEIGLVFGHGMVFVPLLIWKRWRLWYWKLIQNILCWIFPQIYVEYVTHRGQTYATLRWRH